MYKRQDYDDEEEARFLLLDAADGKIDSGDLAGRLAAIQDGGIRKRVKKEAEDLINGFVPSSENLGNARKMFNALVNTRTDSKGNVIVQDPDQASLKNIETMNNMELAYQEE